MDTGIERAIKKIYKKHIDHRQIVAEVESLKKLNHPNLIRLINYHETKNKLFLVQELLLGEQLYERLE